MVKVVETVAAVREQVAEWRRQGLSVGLVPTMGYLHDGHKSLIARSVKENDRTVVSDFVNPIQFGPNEDLDSYPRDLDHDIAVVEAGGGDLIFHPSVEEMYGENFDFYTYVKVEELSAGLCGASRPIHFRGVCTVVSKLFHIVGPDRAYFGQKDAQQLSIIRRMVRDLNFPLEICGCPIVREEDGLAKSSRNTYLNAEERQAALCLSRALGLGKAAIEAGETDAEKVRAIITEEIEREPLSKIDYVEIVDWNNLKPVASTEGSILTAIAVYIGKTRLIDNFIIER
jgi:pantoate--beta-alanine ligase